jgi:hypothetical protein
MTHVTKAWSPGYATDHWRKPRVHERKNTTLRVLAEPLFTFHPTFWERYSSRGISSVSQASSKSRNDGELARVFHDVTINWFGTTTGGSRSSFRIG